MLPGIYDIFGYVIMWFVGVKSSDNNQHVGHGRKLFRSTTISHFSCGSRWWRCISLVTWFCYHLIPKWGNKTGAPSWPDPSDDRAANWYGISVFCTEFTCKIREYEFGLQNTEIELCQFCHINNCCQNKAYLFWVANQSRFVAFYALKPSNTSLITKTFNLLSSTCSSNTFSCLTSCSCSTERIH